MSKTLTASHLIANGFADIGFWSATDQRIAAPLKLPPERGVYAFAVDDIVLYVGLASRSLRQRLNFYASPGASQRTNVRLNGLIRNLINDGTTVRILIAHPQDCTWNGFRMSGPEGLEAALIEDFNLPWNVRGSQSGALATGPRQALVSGGRRAHGSVPRAVIVFVAQNPRCTELQIAKGVFGPDAVQPQANSYCRRLVERGALKRLPTRPATYVLGEKATDGPKGDRPLTTLVCGEWSPSQRRSISLR